MFVNYVNGVVTINTYRKPNAAVTSINDLMQAVDNLSAENLVASVSDVELEAATVLAFVSYHSSSAVDLPIEL